MKLGIGIKDLKVSTFKKKREKRRVSEGRERKGEGERERMRMNNYVVPWGNFSMLSESG